MSDPINGLERYLDVLDANRYLSIHDEQTLIRLLRASVSALQTGMCWEQLKTHMKLKCECPIGDFLALIETELGDVDET